MLRYTFLLVATLTVAYLHQDGVIISNWLYPLGLLVGMMFSDM